MKTKFIPLLTAAVLLAGSTLTAAELSRADRQFFEKAAKAGEKEVTVSSTVLPRLSLPAAREFAETMIADHTKAGEELKALAAQKGVTLPASEQAKHAGKWRDNDKNVDHDYLKEMVDDHQEAVALFEKAAKSEDPDIAAFAQKTLPTLRHHLEQAKIHEKVKVN